ncbi:MAG TPA: sigma-70 family RNA polymerase sigma factor [Actinomycetota bacterium]|nr:sigma-70 family RNA polymerase sigma factor [Actinomycetota bacterium]
MSRTQTIDEARLEDYRAELTGYCYRMLGSAFEAEDAVQETLMRAWRGLDNFDNRSSLRTWLYRIATNACLDMLKSRKRRALPIDLSPASTATAPLEEPLSNDTWIEPIPDGRVLPLSGDPSELAELRESIRLAFVAALQHLPPRQRAVLILRDVLSWSANEVADLLEISVASANSALQRARATLQSKDLSATPQEPVTEAQNVLLTKYVDAFERYDIESFVTLLHEEFTQAMPPYPMWLVGPDEAAAWMLGPGIACKGSVLIPINVNGCPGFGQYRPSGPDGRHEPWAIHLVEIEGDRVARITYFLDTNLFPLFGLPPHPGG